MSSEYPPVIIDSSGVLDEGTNVLSQGPGSLMIRSGEFGGADLKQLVSTEPSVVTLYLIRNTQLIFKGEFTSDRLELIYDDGKAGERTMAVGGGPMSFGSGSEFESIPDDSGGRAFGRSSARVHTIRVPKEPDLQAGRDYDNFILIVRRKAE